MGGGRTQVPGQALACAGRPRSGRRRHARRRPAGREPPAGWPGPAPVPEIVPRVVPVGPGRVEGPVPDPPCASAGGGFGDIGVRDVGVGDEAVAAGHPVAGPGGPDLRPGGAEHIGAVARGQGGHPPVPAGTFGRTPARGPADPLRHRACRYSPNVLRPDGLHTRMRLPPAARTASHGGRRAYRPSPERFGRSPIREGPTRAGRTDHPQALCGVRDIPYQGLNRIIKARENPVI